jgi:hypothetical protein
VRRLRPSFPYTSVILHLKKLISSIKENEMMKKRTYLLGLFHVVLSWYAHSASRIQKRTKKNPYLGLELVIQVLVCGDMVAVRRHRCWLREWCDGDDNDGNRHFWSRSDRI